jgi:rhodanese-related sulfurtransferase
LSDRLAQYNRTPLEVRPALTLDPTHPPSAQALNLLLTDERAVLVDIRTSREVVERGRPLLPPPHDGKYVPRARHVVVGTADDAEFRSAAAVEAGVTAVQLASLRRLRRNSVVILLDQDGRHSEAVAKALTKQGFGKVLVLTGGFKEWAVEHLQSKVGAVPPIGIKGGSQSVPQWF